MDLVVDYFQGEKRAKSCWRRSAVRRAGRTPRRARLAFLHGLQNASNGDQAEAEKHYGAAAGDGCDGPLGIRRARRISTEPRQPRTMRRRRGRKASGRIAAIRVLTNARQPLPAIDGPGFADGIGFGLWLKFLCTKPASAWDVNSWGGRDHRGRRFHSLGGWRATLMGASRFHAGLQPFRRCLCWDCHAAARTCITYLSRVPRSRIFLCRIRFRQ